MQLPPTVRVSHVGSLLADLIWFAAPPLLESLSQGILDYPIFGLYLTRNSSGTLALGEGQFCRAGWHAPHIH